MSDHPRPPTARYLETLATGLAVLSVTQLLVGLWQGREYEVGRGHASLAAMLTRGGPSEFLAAFHLWASHAMLAGALLLILWMLVTGAYGKEWRGRWWSALAFAGSGLLLQVSGNLLPLDRHAVQTAVIEASIAGRVPWVGPWLSERVLAGPGFGAATVDLWYAAHRLVLPGILVVATAGLAWPGRVRRARPLAVATILPLSVAVLMALAVGAPIGEPAGPADANGYDALPGWYVWPMHGAMKGFDSVVPGWGWIGAVVLPGLVATALVLLPFGSQRVSRRALLPTVGILGLALVAVGAFFGGRPASLIADEMLTEEPADSALVLAIRPELAARGATLFKARGCVRCHGLDGSKGSGGPDLTFVHRKHPDPDWYRRFVRNPRSVRPNSTMPAFALSEDDLTAIAEYLRNPRPN
ncbi:MAG: cytochrome b N-terminal domain-containing protein [Fimbriimonadaceae bacterium]|nr:cytochrome b N-terminal domain-containing protein [Fimbriimonadaceae bacterium]